MRYSIVTVLCGFVLLAPVQGKAVTAATIDPEATRETGALFYNLRELAKSKLLFGHQDTTAYGVGWSAEEGRSDVKSVTGSYPAVYGWDIGCLGRERNLDGVEFSRQKKLIREAHERGGINTLSWHMSNPVTGRGYLDRRGRANAVPNVIPGGSHHEELKRRLDLFVEFLGELKDKEGRPIPIIFRPWHENNQRRFWWAVRGDGQDFICSTNQLSRLMRMFRNSRCPNSAWKPTCPQRFLMLVAVVINVPLSFTLRSSPLHVIS